MWEGKGREGKKKGKEEKKSIFRLMGVLQSKMAEKSSGKNKGYERKMAVKLREKGPLGNIYVCISDEE